MNQMVNYKFRLALAGLTCDCSTSLAVVLVPAIEKVIYVAILAKADSPSPAAEAETKARRGGRIATRLPAGDAQSQRLVKFDAPVRTASKKKTRARGDEARRKILDASLECFGAFGFEGTSTRAIADRAGSTHTSVIYHFQSKEQLWIATMEHVLDDYMSGIGVKGTDKDLADPKAILSGFIENFVRMSAKFPQVHRILTMESNQGTPRLAWIIDHFLRDHFLFMKEVITRGQAAGLVRQCDPARLYYLIIGAGGTPFTVWNEYAELTGRDVFSDAEIYRIIAFIHEIVFEAK